MGTHSHDSNFFNPVPRHNSQTEILIQFTQIKLNNLNLKFPLSFLSLTSIIAIDNRKIKNINKTIKKN